MPLSDEKLMLLCRRGSLKAFQVLTVRYQDRLMTWLCSQMRDYQRAQDVFQETFLRVWRRKESFLPPHKFRTWLYAIALNLCRDEWRKARRRPVLVPEPPAPEAGERPAGTPLAELPSSGPSPRELAAARETEAMLNAALGFLSPEQRETVVMAKVMGLSCEEIAEINGVPAGTVRSRLHYALKEIKKRLKAEG
jgi:RNA polymerase sigma-70 factor (ECF subfamily)